MIAVGYFIYKNPTKRDAGENTSNVTQTKEQKIVSVGKEVLKALKDKDYVKLQSLTSKNGLSLNIYPNLDLSKSQVSKIDVGNISSDTKTTLWGYTDGKGDPINLTTKDFLAKFIYDADYLNAPDVAINKTLDGGTNSLNMIVKDISGRDFAAFHFGGFDSKYGGMDWTTIYLVFDIENGTYLLRGIAKDNWTI